MKSALAYGDSRQNGANIADDLLRLANVLLDQIPKGAVRLSPRKEIAWGDPQSFLINVGGIAGVGTRNAAADVAHMRFGSDIGGQIARRQRAA